MGRKMGGQKKNPALNKILASCSTDHILGEPDPSTRVYDKAHAYTMQRLARQVNEMPTGWPFVHHTFLYAIYTSPGIGIRACKDDVFTTIGKACTTFIGTA